MLDVIDTTRSELAISNELLVSQRARNSQILELWKINADEFQSMQDRHDELLARLHSTRRRGMSPCVVRSYIMLYMDHWRSLQGAKDALAPNLNFQKCDVIAFYDCKTLARHWHCDVIITPYSCPGYFSWLRLWYRRMYLQLEIS